MIERNGFGDMASFDITCNECRKEENFDTDGDFGQAIHDAKDRGWKVFKVGTQWQHKCPDCASEQKRG